METKKTIGSMAEQKAQEYFITYKQLKSNDRIKVNCEQLAKHDLVIENIINDLAIKRLTELIKEVQK